MRQAARELHGRSTPTIAPRKTYRKVRRAAAAVELALTLPLLLLLTFGAIELGRAVSVYSMVSCAARAGAEYGATHGYSVYTYSSWQTQVTQQVQNSVQGNASLDATQLSVAVNATPETGGFNLTTVTANYQFNTITQWPGLPHQFTITHTVGMRRYR
ncbi:MAG TPA: TadE/TadG family type IV pilus assembly protein [Planctomycetaceae bacterium]|jgi:Flp pilus assembly protein TadG|nr:TadE/TadG family type IV pilus assembly protein [Planctomycetaceae bacterium]